jgi:hypothetical protein
MMSNEPSPQALRYIKLINYRLNELPEEEIANKLGFDSPTELYRQVSQEGYPICPVCGTTDVSRSHCSPERKYKRQARRGMSEAEELPPAEAAAPLFHQALKKLDWEIVDLQNRHEYWHDGRFVAQEVYNDPVLRDGEWIDEATTNIPLGGKQHPADPLTTLIAVYVLAGLPLKPLVDILHRAPETVDFEYLKAQIVGKRTKTGHKPGLRSKAEHLARLVRGAPSPLKSGRDTGAFTEREQNAIWYMRDLEARGFSRPAIVQEMTKRGFSKEDIERFSNFKNLPPPKI